MFEAFKPSHSDYVSHYVSNRGLLLTDGKGDTYRYAPIKGNHWAWIPMPDQEIMQELATTLTDFSQGTLYALLALVKSYTTERGHQWSRLQSHRIPFLNGVYDLKNMTLSPYVPHMYINRFHPVEYSAEAQCPRWLAALDTWFGQDPDGADKIRALQQFFGYVLMPGASLKKALVCTGPSNTGKTVIAKILLAMVGLVNTCNVPVSKMADPRHLAAIENKILNLITEVPTGEALADDGFKTLVSLEEPVFIAPVGKPGRQIIPRAKHAIFCNTLPRVRDLSEAVYNRLLILEMTHPIPPSEQNPFLAWELISTELEGIVQWAVEGARELLIAQQGRFLEPASSQTRRRQYRQDQNPVLAFLEENCVPNPDSFIPMETFRQRFYQWSGANKLSSMAITQMLKESGYQVGKKRIGNNIPRALFNVAWSPEVEHTASGEPLEGTLPLNVAQKVVQGATS